MPDEGEQSGEGNRYGGSKPDIGDGHGGDAFQHVACESDEAGFFPKHATGVGCSDIAASVFLQVDFLAARNHNSKGNGAEKIR